MKEACVRTAGRVEVDRGHGSRPPQICRRRRCQREERWFWGVFFGL